MHITFLTSCTLVFHFILHALSVVLLSSLTHNRAVPCRARCLQRGIIVELKIIHHSPRGIMSRCYRITSDITKQFNSLQKTISSASFESM